MITVLLSLHFSIDPLNSVEQLSLFLLSYLSSKGVSSEESKDKLNSSEELLGALLDRKYLSASSLKLPCLFCLALFSFVMIVGVSYMYWSASGRSDNEYSMSGHEWTLPDEDCSEFESGVIHDWWYFRLAEILMVLKIEKEISWCGSYYVIKLLNSL